MKSPYPFQQIKQSALLFLILLTIQTASAQDSRFTFDAKVGTNLINGSVSPFPGANASLNLRFSPCRLISVSSFIGTGLLWGNGDATRIAVSDVDNVNRYYTERFMFNTEYYNWGGNVYLNLQNLFNPTTKPKRIIAYVFTGAGYMRTRSLAESLETRNAIERYMTYFNAHIGIEVKIKGNKNLDYLFSIQDNITETPYLDGIPYDGKYDSFISISAGISYQIKFNKRHTNIDWTRGNVCPLFRYKI